MFERLRLGLAKRIAPFAELGVGGSTSYGGYLQPPFAETTPGLHGSNRYRKAHEILTDVSIVAASVRYFNNLVSRPTWKAKPPSDKAEAKAAAEFMESVIHGTDTSWSRTVRRSATFKFHGFGFHEWTAMRRPDGAIGMASVEPRPQHTIIRWDRDRNGTVTGVVQRAPQDGREIILPREKLVYLLDDSLTDSPEGLGWFRHLVEPAKQLKRYLKLETIGFERDLSGIPIGRAPISAINAMIGKMVPDGEGGERMFTKADADELIKGIRDFVTLKARQPETGLLVDSQPFVVTTDSGKQVSNVLQWGLELLTGSSASIGSLGEAVRRITFDMALIMGTQDLLIGREGAGSMALSINASRNLAMNVNACLTDMAESFDRDLVGPTWAMNGLPEDLRPKLEVEDAAFKDVEQVARVLRDMSAAGAILHPNDPAINDVRALAGLSPQKALTPEEIGMLTGANNPDDALPPDESGDGN